LGEERTFSDLFRRKKPLLAVLHLKPLPGAPLYSGTMDEVYRTALEELEVYRRSGADGVIVENFNDMPFFPGRVPAATVAAMAAVTRDIVQAADVPVGVNVLRNDAHAAVAVAVASGAEFVRVNVLLGVSVADQGLVQGVAHDVLRLRSTLRSSALILADVDVKHAVPLGGRSLREDTRDITERGLADAIIVSGARTGGAADIHDVEEVKANTHLPVLLGSGVNGNNLTGYFSCADGFIVGSCFKVGGQAVNRVEEERVQRFVNQLEKLRSR
jgi:hypothetical protein